MNIPDGYEPAFPFACQGPTTGPEIYYGMTLRDWFAGQALVGTVTHWEEIESYLASTGGPDDANSIRKFMASAAYAQADAMIEERNRKL